jgi:hypothetical protein
MKVKPLQLSYVPPYSTVPCHLYSHTKFSCCSENFKMVLIEKYSSSFKLESYFIFRIFAGGKRSPATVTRVTRAPPAFIPASPASTLPAGDHTSKVPYLNAVLRIRVVHPGSGSGFFTHSGSRLQGSKRHRIPDPDPQHCLPNCFTGIQYRVSVERDHERNFMANNLCAIFTPCNLCTVPSSLDIFFNILKT